MLNRWARKLQALGYTVRLAAPQLIKPYAKSNTKDAADAEAICKAVDRPSVRFVPTKTSSSSRYSRYTACAKTLGSDCTCAPQVGVVRARRRRQANCDEGGKDG